MLSAFKTSTIFKLLAKTVLIDAWGTQAWIHNESIDWQRENNIPLRWAGRERITQEKCLVGVRKIRKSGVPVAGAKRRGIERRLSVELEIIFRLEDVEENADRTPHSEFSGLTGVPGKADPRCKICPVGEIYPSRGPRVSGKHHAHRSIRKND